MADSADESAAQEEFFERTAFHNHQLQARKHARLISDCRGRCLNCDDECEASAYCSAECQEDHEKRLRSQAQQRRI